MQSSTSDRATRFRIVDFGESRQDLHSRTEVKFTTHDADLGKLRAALATLCQARAHGRDVSRRPVSWVRSLYFDSPEMSACLANLQGLGQRQKLRLRWYDQLLPAEDFYMEIKWRKNRVTGKHRFKMQSDTPLSQMRLKEIHRQLVEVTPREHVREVCRFSEPIVVVQYCREHFQSPDREMRLTMDYDLRFYDQVAKSRLALRLPMKMDGFCVIEGKTPIGREAELKAMLSSLSLRADRCSKYVHGCRLLGHIRVGE